jgi:iron complex transport system substrate-binding protein
MPTPAPTPSPYPVAYTNCGVSNTVSAAPTKAITMNQGATEFLLAMGLEDSMVGTAYLDDAIWPKYATAYASIPVLSSSYPDHDTIMDKNPDLIVASYSSAFRALYTTSSGSVRGVFNMSCTGTGSEYTDSDGNARDWTTCRPQLNAMNIGTYVFEDACEDASLRPDSVTEETVYEELQTLGEIFSVNVTTIIDDMKEDFAAAAALVSSSMSSDPLKTVWLDCVGRCCTVEEGEEEEVFVGAGEGAPNMLMREAGLTNVFSGEAGNWACVKVSSVIAAAPDVIVVVDAAWDTAASKIQWLYNDEEFCKLDVLKRAAFVSIPFSATTLSPRNGPAAYDLAIAAIHVRTGAVTPAQESGVTSFNPYFIQAESECGKCPMSISDVVYTEASDDDTVTVECPDEETASKGARAGTAALYASLAASAVALSQVSCA